MQLAVFWGRIALRSGMGITAQPIKGPSVHLRVRVKELIHWWKRFSAQSAQSFTIGESNLVLCQREDLTTVGYQKDVATKKNPTQFWYRVLEYL